MPKQRKELVESCIALPVSLLIADAPKEGSVTINGRDRTLEVSYELSQNDILDISFDGKEQCFELKKIPAFRGVKTFFVCSCGKRCRNLYLRPDGERFGCRRCNDLNYLSSRTTRDTVNGTIFSDFSKLSKLIERREKLRSIWYRGEPTVKFKKLLTDAERYGFNEFVNWQRSGIQDLMDMKKAVEIARNG